MGSEIAESAARSGLDVALVDRDPVARERSRDRIEESVARAVAGEELDEADVKPLLERIEFGTDLEAVRDSALIVEAVFEDPAVKGPLVRELDELLRDDAVPASNMMGPRTLCDPPPPLLQRMVVSGHHGRKTGHGFYEYAVERDEIKA